MESKLERLIEQISKEVLTLRYSVDSLQTQIDEIVVKNDVDYSIGTEDEKWTTIELGENFPKTFLASSNGNTELDLGIGEMNIQGATIKCCHCRCCNK